MNETQQDRDTDSAETEARGAADRFQQNRRDFLDLCGRMSIAVPPAIVLLASSRQALASHGTHTDTPSYGDGDTSYDDQDGHDGWDSEKYALFRRWLRRIRLIIWGGY